MSITPDLKRRACDVDLGRWLLTNHPEAVVHKHGSVLLKANQHVAVKLGYHGYIDFQSGETGNAIDYLINYLGYNFREAVWALSGESPEADVMPGQQSAAINTTTLTPSLELDAKSFQLPERASHTKNVFAYLRGRGIPSDMLQALLKEGLLYQSAPHNNAVFVTPEKDYYEVRGTNTYIEPCCRKSRECSDYKADPNRLCTHMWDCDRYKKNTFHGCGSVKPGRFWYLPTNGDTQKIYVCEAAIDAISLSVLHQRAGVEQGSIYVSIGGAAKQVAIDRLKSSSRQVIIATDNDEAGDACRERNKGLATIRPSGKDWNQDLISVGGGYEK